MIRNWFPIALVLVFLLAVPSAILFALDLAGYEGDVNAWMESHFSLSHHIPLATWAATLMFLVPIGIILLYFLKLKRKPQTVSSTFLWKKSIEDLHVNRLFQWLRRNILLLLQLLVCLSLLYAVIAPRLHGATSSGKHYILVIDNSASMSAVEEDGSRLEWAKRQAIREIDAATDDDFGMVIAFNSTAEIRQSYTGNRALLRSAVSRIQATQQPTRLDEALSLAESLANPLRSTENEATRPQNPEPGKERTYVPVEGIPTEVHLFSDGRFPDVPEFALTNLFVQYHAAGKPDTANNVAIVRFDAIRDEDNREEVLVDARVLNFRDEEVTGKLKLDVYVNGQLRTPIDRTLKIAPRKKVIAADGKELRTEPGEQRVTFELKGIEENADVVMETHLSDIDDVFPLDNDAYLVLGIVRKAQVLIVGPSNPILKIFFDAEESKKVAEVTYISADDLKNNNAYLDPARSGKYDLVVFDRCAPAAEDEMPRANTFFIGYAPPPWNMDKLEKVQFPQIRGWTDQHAVMRGVRGWHEIEIAEGFRLTDLPPRTPRLLEGDRDLVLMCALSRSSFTDLVMAFPLETNDGKWNSRWFLRPSFPYFMRNVMYALGNIRDASTEETVRPGMIKRLRPGGIITEMTITSPNDAVTKLERGARTEFLFGATDEVGIYTVEWADQERRFAVNLFDADESNLEPRAEFRIGSEVITSGENRAQPRELWKWAVLAGLVYLFGEW